MALHLREVALELEGFEEALGDQVARTLQLNPAEILSWKIVRKGVDARKKAAIRFVYTVEFTVADEEALLRAQEGNPRLARKKSLVPPVVPSSSPAKTVVVVGMGPAGLFAARHLALAGASVILLEQGAPVEQRVKTVDRFWDTGEFDPRSNTQFGEGGAGTFSDGKLTTRVKNPWNQSVLQALVDYGAPPEILYDAKPHVGTDRLRLVLIRFRQHLQTLGVDLRFHTRLDSLLLEKGQLVGARLGCGTSLSCDAMILAPGHSARETYEMLFQSDVALTAKPFAVGVRVEHPVEVINQIQYGRARHPRLPAADYALAWNDQRSGRGVYSFCMCPGGEVITASSEADGVVVNGMSRLARKGDRSNAALVVSVGPDDFDGRDPLAGMRFQRHWEQQAFAAAGGGHRAPAQNMLAFLQQGDGPLDSSCRPAVTPVDLAQVLPVTVTDHLRRALPQFNRRMKGFVCREAVLVGVETRTSAPLRILRGDNGESVSHPGLFPAGEGAGYAGGIMSAALDGIRAAQSILTRQVARSVQ